MLAAFADRVLAACAAWPWLECRRHADKFLANRKNSGICKKAFGANSKIGKLQEEKPRISKMLLAKIEN